MNFNDRQYVVLRAIAGYLDDNGFGPYDSELEAKTSLPRTTIAWHRNRLRERRFITMRGKDTRTIRLTSVGENWLKMMHQVQAIQNHESTD